MQSTKSLTPEKLNAMTDAEIMVLRGTATRNNKNLFSLMKICAVLIVISLVHMCFSSDILGLAWCGLWWAIAFMANILSQKHEAVADKLKPLGDCEGQLCGELRDIVLSSLQAKTLVDAVVSSGRQLLYIDYAQALEVHRTEQLAEEESANQLACKQLHGIAV